MQFIIDSLFFLCFESQEKLERLDTPYFFIDNKVVLQSDIEKFIAKFNLLDKKIVKKCIGSKSIEQFNKKEIAYLYYFIVHILNDKNPLEDINIMNEKLKKQGDKFQFLYEDIASDPKNYLIRTIIVNCALVDKNSAKELIKYKKANNLFETQVCVFDKKAISNPIKEALAETVQDLLKQGKTKSDIIFNESCQIMYYLEMLKKDIPLDIRAIKYFIESDNQWIALTQQYLIKNQITLILA